MECPHCGSIKTESNGYCATFNHEFRKAERIKLKEVKPIKKVSDKLAIRLKEYGRIKARWLPGKKCAVHKELDAIEPHHSAGRSPDEYYDEWAQERDIPLLNDIRFWVPVSREGHIEIELNRAWAESMGYTESRLTVKNKMI